MEKHAVTRSRFRQLRWRLTLNYTAVTVGALITVELILFLVLAGVLSVILKSGLLQRQLIEVASDSYSQTLRYFLSQTPPDEEGLSIWLESVGAATSTTIPFTFEPTSEMLVVGRNGTLLAARPPGLMAHEAFGRPVDAQTIPGLPIPLQAALAGTRNVEELYTRPGSHEKVVLVIPIWDGEGTEVLGALVGIEDSPSVIGFLRDALPVLAISLLLFTLIAGAIGTVYGYLSARGPVQRLDRLVEATLTWGEGDFSARVEDPEDDELGQLAGRLNDMAGQMEQLMDTRRELAVIEERQRLARDLHDSAKQLAFAAAARIGGVRPLLQRDPAAAAGHLQEAERLIDELRRELTGMILELRPPAMTGEGLPRALENYLAEWARQNGIDQEAEVQGAYPLPAVIEQPLFRIFQEALANVARHSGATRVTVTLAYTTEAVTLKVDDDGRGFEPGSEQVGFGLTSMRQRAEDLGGSLTVHSTRGTGTSVTCTVPVESPTESEEEVTHG